jgi:hypothetical protein
MRQLEEESNRSEPETDEEEDEAAIPYAETSGSDDSMDGGDDPVRSFDPNFKLPGSDASMFH